MFRMSYGIMGIGFILIIVGWLIALLSGGLITLVLSLIIIAFGFIFCLFSLVRIHFDTLDSTLYHLIEEPQKGMVNWLFAYHDGEIIVTPAMRKIERFSQNAKLDQQVKEWKTYRFAGHTIRIVGSGIGFSIDLGACVKVRQLKRDFGIKNIFDIRKVFRPHLNELKPKEEVDTLENAQRQVGMQPILPGGVK